MNKLGLVLECDAGGPDELTFKCLARRLAGIDPVCATMGSKEGVFLRGVEAARELVESSGCGLVLIAWDLKPLWAQVAAKDCRDEAAELQKQREALPAATRKKIRLLCLTYELETWLISEDRAVREYLSTKAHKSKFQAPKDAPWKTDAKAFLNGVFKAAKGQRYVDYVEAIRLVQRWPDTRRVGEIDSFRRFSELLTGDPDADFKWCGDACADLVHQAAMLGKG